MSQLWKVYRESEILGPMSAAELRQALREGVVDPFDLVGKVGSKLRLELIEADEVFVVDENAPKTPQFQTFKVPPNDKVQGLFRKEKTKINELYEKVRSQVTGSPQRSGDASPQGHRPSKSDAQRRNMHKIYYALDPRGRSLGPLAGSEVVGLYQRGILSRDVRIHKGGTSRKISIGRFVAMYAGQRMQALARVPGKGVPRSHPNSQVINEMARGVAIRQQRTEDVYTHPVVMIAIGLIIGIVLFFIVESGILKKRKVDSPKRQKQNTAVSHEEEVPLSAPPRDNQNDVVKPKLVKPQTAVALSNKPAEVTKEKKTSAAASRQGAGLQPRVADGSSISRPSSTGRPVPESNKTLRRMTPKPIVSKEKIQSKRPPRKPAQAKGGEGTTLKQHVKTPGPDLRGKVTKPSVIKKVPSHAGGSFSDLDSKIGKTVTLGPLSFNRSTVGACTMKCKVTFSDGEGHAITGIFFKDAPYGDMLRSSSGKVTITGTIRKDGSGFSMLISGVKLN